MAKQLGLACRNAVIDIIETTIGTAPILEMRAAAPPADPSVADAGTLIVSIALPSDWLTAAAAAVKTLLGTWQNNAAASGIPRYYRIKNTAGTVVHEQGLVSEVWAATKAYLVGQQVSNGGNVYVATAAGTSAGAGGPTGTGTGIADGTVTWNFVATGPDLTLQNTNINAGQQVSVTAYSLNAGNA